MKVEIIDDFDDSVHEFDIPDELYNKVYGINDKDALYEMAILIDSKQEMSDLPIIDMMEDAWDEGEGSVLAGDWLDEYYSCDDDGRYDAWV